MSTEKPLSNAALHVLLAIGPEERHGYAIMAEVTRISGQTIRMGPGTLYGTLKKLLAENLIEEIADASGTPDDQRRRRYYRLTVAGRSVVAREVNGLERMMNRSGAREWAAGGPIE